MQKTLVLYVHHLQTERTNYFVENAIFIADDTDFLVISNGCNPPPNLPSHVEHITVPNVGYDFGGWSHGILDNDRYKNYTHFIFVNSSVWGPIMTGALIGKRWTDVFLEGLSDDVKLFGSTINASDISGKDSTTCSHVQSYVFAMDVATLLFLCSKTIFSTTNYCLTFHDAIYDREIRMSTELLRAGHNIGCLTPHYQGVDFRFLMEPVGGYPDFLCDMMFPSYLDKTAPDYLGIVFIKGNRFGKR